MLTGCVWLEQGRNEAESYVEVIERGNGSWSSVTVYSVSKARAQIEASCFLITVT
jgi:hypothetical protein